jgi:hypothetical protein
MLNSAGVCVTKVGLSESYGQSTLLGIIENMLLKNSKDLVGKPLKDRGVFVVNMNNILSSICNTIVSAQANMILQPEEKLEDIKFISYNMNDSTSVTITYFVKTVANILFTSTGL